MGKDTNGAAPLVVLQSFTTPTSTTNPYIHMLFAALDAQDDLDVRAFRWRRALVGRYDVFHAHWPEVRLRAGTPARSLVAQALFALLLARLALTRTAVVRTVHNVDLPSGLARRERWLLEGLERLTTLRIALNPATPGSPGERWVVIPHGHYREWMAAYPRQEPRPGQLAYVGLVRRYKNVDGLVAAFRDLDGDYRLSVAGNPSSPGLRENLESAAGRDGRIELDLRFLADADIARTVTRAELVVLPYRLMHNSGSVLMALSLDRPVLVPATPTNELLAVEVGRGWVHQYTGTLTGQVLRSALEAHRARGPVDVPDLSARDWPPAAAAHARAYREAVAARRGARAYSA